MANNDITPYFERLIQYKFDTPVSTTVNKKGYKKHRYNLNLTEVVIYGHFVSGSFDGWIDDISVNEIADTYLLSRKSVKNAIQSLKSAGLISVDHGVYSLLILPSQIKEMCDEQGIKFVDNL
ncbi:GntR family transcriptional regulator [Escherichia coli]|nr:GntR family transcriptional regulator [Escherichia coli]